ncbi:hypothetical protein [Acaryochloris thomasi]|uniref:hypothetical protein n=1 Tax=Acaryochloris thomasi TaxID=2929456 RepID=UPI0013150203|nr:hypothetical protein [Acaryochloris thomasi]
MVVYRTVDLYDPDKLREADDPNDKTRECIYIGRRVKNDTKCLEKLFELCTTMTKQQKG